MVYGSNTIAASATALSDSGIGIIRVSGDEAIAIVDKIYRGKNSLYNYETHTIHYGFIYDGEELVDEVLVSIFKGPKSYTAEDTVEINCHGGVFVVRRVLELVIQHGARIADPGEFTKRAFLNGRIDLSRAEAVMDIIHAKNNFALKTSAKQVNGSLYHLIKELQGKILYEIAFIESALDDPEHISLDGYRESLQEKNEYLIEAVNRLYRSADNGKLLKEGINTVIVGKPNAGKSSLLNRMVGEEKAIVTNIAGTTRDVIEERINLFGIGLNIVDTAGIRDTDDIVEKIGVEKAKNFAVDADLIIYVVDSSIPLDESDRDILNLIKDKKVIILLNKTDLHPVVDEHILNTFMISEGLSDHESSCTDSHLQRRKEKMRILKFSAKQGLGLDHLEKVIEEMFFSREIQMNDEVILTNLRQKEAVKECLDSLLMVKKSIEEEMAEDFLSIDLMGAYTALGTVIGEEVGDDVVNEIFSKFCMGK